jgi:hypothetical protein
VFLVNRLAAHPTEAKFLALPKRVYDCPEEEAADG